MADESKTLTFKNDDTGARFAVREGSLAHQRMIRPGAGFSEVRSLSGGPEVRTLPHAEDAAERRRAQALAESLANALNQRQGEGAGQSGQSQNEGQGS